MSKHVSQYKPTILFPNQKAGVKLTLIYMGYMDLDEFIWMRCQSCTNFFSEALTNGFKWIIWMNLYGFDSPFYMGGGAKKPPGLTLAFDF